jgi:hypothetical protein
VAHQDHDRVQGLVGSLFYDVTISTAASYKPCHASFSSGFSQSFPNEDSLIVAVSNFSRMVFALKKMNEIEYLGKKRLGGFLYLAYKFLFCVHDSTLFLIGFFITPLDFKYIAVLGWLPIANLVVIDLSRQHRRHPEPAFSANGYLLVSRSVGSLILIL